MEIGDYDENEIESFTSRLDEIEKGKILPTFEEFFKLCILYHMAERVNLKELYPTLYKQYKTEIKENAIKLNMRKIMKGEYPIVDNDSETI